MLTTSLNPSVIGHPATFTANLSATVVGNQTDTVSFWGKIRGYTGSGRFTHDPLDTFGGAGLVEIPEMQKLLRYICEKGFEHHVAANFSSVAPVVHEAATRYLGWEMYAHGS